MWAPIGAATAYYLGASVLLPKEAAHYDDLAGYLAGRRRVVIWMMIAGEVFVKVTYLPHFIGQVEHRPAVFWLWSLPLNVAIFGVWFLLLLARRPRTVIIGAVAQLAIFVVSYWSSGWISAAIAQAFHS